MAARRRRTESTMARPARRAPSRRRRACAREGGPWAGGARHVGSGPRKGGGRWRRAGHSENAPSQQCGQTGITGCLADLVIVPPPLLRSDARARRWRGRGAHRKACHGPRLLLGQGRTWDPRREEGVLREERGRGRGRVARRVGCGSCASGHGRGAVPRPCEAEGLPPPARAARAVGLPKLLDPHSQARRARPGRTRSTQARRARATARVGSRRVR